MHLQPSLSRRLFALLLGLTAIIVTQPGQTADPTMQNLAVDDQQRQVADQLSQTLAAIETKQEQIAFQSRTAGGRDQLHARQPG